MSKALPIAVAVLLGGAALVPVYYATKTPATQSATSTLLLKKSVMRSVMKSHIKHHLSWILIAL